MKKATLTPRAYPAIPGESRRTKARKQAIAKAPARPEGLVEAPNYDRMSAPAWTETLSPSNRPGANDFQRIASRGLRC